MANNVDQVWVGRMPLQMRGERAPMDKLLFTMLAMAAAFERDWIVSRTNAGKLNKLRNNIWIAGERALPIGYVMDEHKHLVPDETQRELVRDVLLLVAERPTPKEFVTRLGALGVKMQPLPSVQLGERNVRHSQNALGKWLSVLSYLPLYATGQHVSRHPNPFAGAEEISGCPVTRDEDGREEVQIVTFPGVPDGGWAEPEIVSAALAVAIDDAQERGSRVLHPTIAKQVKSPLVRKLLASLVGRKTSKKTKAPTALPLSGSTWNTEPGMTWQLNGREAVSYTLVRWREDVSAQPADHDDESGNALERPGRGADNVGGDRR
jgi:hypothetical protein